MHNFGRDGRISNYSVKLTPTQIIDAELSTDEKLIWAGAPISLIEHSKLAIPQFLFGIPFFSFAVFWIWQASSFLREGLKSEWSSFDYVFPMFGIPFVIVGLGMLLSPVWKAFKARKTVYALTDKRLIIRETLPTIKVKSWRLDKLGPLYRTGPIEGPGNLYFAEETMRHSDGVKTSQIGFIGIDQPRKLEDKIRNIIQKSEADI